MRLVWSASALADRMAIFDYLADRSPKAALNLDDRFLEAVGVLTSNPQAGRIGRVDGTREIVAHRRYLIVYRALADEVAILAIVHASRRWPP